MSHSRNGLAFGLELGLIRGEASSWHASPFWKIDFTLLLRGESPLCACHATCLVRFAPELGIGRQLQTGRDSPWPWVSVTNLPKGQGKRLGLGSWASTGELQDTQNPGGVQEKPYKSGGGRGGVCSRLLGSCLEQPCGSLQPLLYLQPSPTRARARPSRLGWTCPRLPAALPCAATLRPWDANRAWTLGGWLQELVLAVARSPQRH